MPAKHYESLGRVLRKQAKTMAVKLSGRQADARDGSTGPQAKQWAVGCAVGRSYRARRGAVSSVNLIMGIYRATVTATLRDGSGQRGEEAVHRTCHISKCSYLLFIVDRVHNIQSLDAPRSRSTRRVSAALRARYGIDKLPSV
jgi:hypothetical protein